MTTAFRGARRAISGSAAVLCVMAVVALAGAAPAAAARLEEDAGSAGLLGLAGETNGFDVTQNEQGGVILISDTSGPITVVATHCSSLFTGAALCDPAFIKDLFVSGGDGNDRITVNAYLPANVCGEAGNDVITGGAGDDTVWGGAGADQVAGGAGQDIVGADQPLGWGPIYCTGGGAPAADALSGGPGNDVVLADAGDDTLDGGDGNDIEAGADGADRLAGGPGDDVLNGGAGNDALDGGDGNDRLGMTIDVNLAFDIVRVLAHSEEGGDDDMNGGPGDDSLSAGTPQGGVYLGGGTPPPVDTSLPNGADTFRGGEGHDKVTYGTRTAPLSLSKDDQRNDGAAGEGDFIASDVESLIAGASNDVVTGGPGPDEVEGSRGADVVRGGPGDDLVDGGPEDASADRVDGDAGNDRVGGGPGPDTIGGGDGNDSLLGELGADTIAGGAGDDTIFADVGGQNLLAGLRQTAAEAGLIDTATKAGPATYLPGGTGASAASVRIPRPAPVKARTAADASPDSLDGGPGNDQLVGADGNETLSGGDGNDNLGGGIGADRLLGGAGNDTIFGGVGNDYVDPGAGLNRIEGDAGTDTLDFSTRTTATNIDLGRGRAGLAATPSTDRFKEIENAVGGRGADVLVGSKGANVLKGGAGSDYLDGKDGADGLEGGAGGDLLVSRDRVRDAVDCAAGQDQALVDRRDRPKGCERVERGAVPARGGHDVALTPDGCSAKVRPEGWSRFVPLTTGMTAGSGTAIQTAKCEVRIGVRLGSSATAAVLRSGKAELRRVQGGLSATVVDAGRCSSKRSKKELGRLTVRSIGLVRVTGRRSRSSGSGATWRTTDRCDATITQVTRGSVLVDPSNGAARRLGAGGRLVAP